MIFCVAWVGAGGADELRNIVSRLGVSPMALTLDFTSGAETKI